MKTTDTYPVCATVSVDIFIDMCLAAADSLTVNPPNSRAWRRILKHGVVVMLVSAASFAFPQQTGGDQKDEAALTIIQDSKAAYAKLSSYSDSGTAVTEVNGLTLTNTFTSRVARTNLYLIEWETEATMFTKKKKGAVWSAGDGDYYLARHSIKKMDIDGTMALASGVSVATVSATFLDAAGGGSLRQLLTDCSEITQGKDEKVGSVDCYVVIGKRQKNEMSIVDTRWIGKEDRLIHKSGSETEMGDHGKIHDQLATLSGPGKELMEETMRRLQGKPVTFTEMHENIKVNKPFAKSDFVHEQSPSD